MSPKGVWKFRHKIGKNLVGPDVPQEDGLVVRPETEGLGLKIDVHSASQGVGDHQRGAGQVVGPGVRMNSTLEVAVAYIIIRG